MKLTKKFWAWVGQVLAAYILLLRMDLICALFNLIPNVDLSQFILKSAWAGWVRYFGYCGLAGAHFRVSTGNVISCLTKTVTVGDSMANE